MLYPVIIRTTAEGPSADAVRQDTQEWLSHYETEHQFGVIDPLTVPSGECLCGCGQRPKRGSFFMKGHDVIAVREAIGRCYGEAALFVLAHR